jgi:hypothetical protein
MYILINMALLVYLLKCDHVAFQYERFFQPGATVVASVFAPIMFPPAPVLVYKMKRDGTQVICSLLYFHAITGKNIIVVTTYPSYTLSQYKVDSDVSPQL